MTRNALCLHFLKYLTGRKDVVTTNQLKSKMFGYKTVSGDELLEELAKKRYVTINDSQVKVTDVGKTFLEDLEKTEFEKINVSVFDDYDLALIGFLFNRNDFVKLEDFPETLKVCAPQYGNSINDGNLMQSLFRLRAYISEQFGWYIINDIGKTYYQNKIGIHYQNSTNNNKAHGKVSNRVIPALNESERLWLTELYQFTKTGRIFTYRELWAKLAKKLPRDFKPSAVDERFISSDGEKIRILGVVALEGNFGIIDQINKVVNSIRELVLENEAIQNIKVEEIATICGLAAKDVSFSLELARYYVNLYNRSSYEERSTELISIDVSGSEAIFYNYLHFEGIEFYLTKQHENNNSVSEEYFSADEIGKLNEKLDYLTEQMQNVILSQQFSYDDVMDELNELKELYGLKRKNWKRLLVAKITEMTAGGVVSSVIAEPLADIIKPELNRLLTQ